MIPDLQASIVCDDVRQERNGKFILIGLFDVIHVQAFPAVFQRICIVNRWCCGEGEFKERTRIIGAQKGAVIAEGNEIPVRLPNAEMLATNVEFFINVTFPMEGVCWIEVLLDGEMKLRYPMRVMVLKNQPPPGKGPTLAA